METANKNNQNKFEQLNHVMLRGAVGRVKVTNAGKSKVARISLATNYSYKNQDGTTVTETTWHSINAWQNSSFPDLEKIKSGDKLYVEGRIRTQKYTDQEGHEHTMTEILARKLELC